MKLFVFSLLAATSFAAPQIYQTVSGTVVNAQSNFPAVMKIPSPGVNIGTAYISSAAVPVPAPIVKTASVLPPIPVVRVAPTTAVKASYEIPVLKSAVVPQVKNVADVAPAVVVVQPPRPLDAPEPPIPSLKIPHVGGQFHSQDESGGYTFGHYGGPNTRIETKDSLGRTSGSFAYVDPEGEVQVRKYAAAPASGFRVAASDLVVDTPEVAMVKSAHERARQAVLSLTGSSIVTI